ncbi:GNAT family N-acetyltransferase, partial [Hafnia alvei]
MLMTKNGVTIREIIASDRAGWEHLWQQYLHFYRADVSAEITEKTFIRLCQKQDLVGLVAVNDQGEILGFMH